MACFLIGATSPGWCEEGDALIGSVSDDPYDVRTYLRIIRSAKDFAHIGTELVSTTVHTLTERGYFSRHGETSRGINEVGLAFTCAMVIEDENFEKRGNPIHYADVTDEMMRSCETVDDAIALFKSKEAMNPAYSVLLADARGGLVHLEVGNFGIEVFRHYTRDNPGAVFAVNCYQSQDLEVFNAPHTLLSNPENNNMARLQSGKQLAEELGGSLTVKGLASILIDHTNSERDPMENPILEGWGFSICNHGTRSKDDYPDEDLPWGTVSAEILQPSQGIFWYAYGWPCGAQPEHGDQIFQENSWGKFIPFALTTNKKDAAEVTPLTTPSGKVTGFGIQHMAFRVHAVVIE